MSSWHDFSTSDAGETQICFSGLEQSAILKFNGSVDSGSNRRRRLDPVYEKLTSLDFLNSMARGHIRVKRLLSKSGRGFGEKLKELDDCFECFFTSVDNLEINEKAADKCQLVSLTKIILEGWEDIENGIGQAHQSLFSWFEMAPSDYPHAVPSAWLFECEWRDKAYEEVLSIKKYSYLLDQAYLDLYKRYSEKNKGNGLTLLRHKKLLNFLGSTKEDISFLSAEKCYKRVMGIKQFTTRRDLVSLRASRSCLTDQVQLPNWRDEIFVQIRASRKMYSLELDKNLCGVDGLQVLVTGGTLDNDKKAGHSFIEKSLQFLAKSRADLAFLSKEDCLRQLADIKLFIQSTGSSTGLADGMTNWRDLEYEQLQKKADRFRYQVYGVYLTFKVTWSKIPWLAEQFKKLEGHMKKALGFYEMPRARMSLLESRDDYFKLVDSITEDVRESISLIEDLLHSLRVKVKGTGHSWDCDPSILIPKLPVQ